MSSYHTVRLKVRKPFGHPRTEWVEEHTKILASDREDAIRQAMQISPNPDWVTAILPTDLQEGEHGGLGLDPGP